MPLLNSNMKLKTRYLSINLRNNANTVDICTENIFSRILKKERERANRNEHQFSLIVLEFNQAKIDQKEIGVFLTKITRRIRLIDEIGWCGPNCIGIILPYTSACGARQFIDSLGDLIDSCIPISNCTICTYPLKNDSENDDKGIMQ